jgi:hypothetical protein
MGNFGIEQLAILVDLIKNPLKEGKPISPENAEPLERARFIKRSFHRRSGYDLYIATSTGEAYVNDCLLNAEKWRS